MFGNEPSFKRNIEKGHICVIRWLVACPGARAVRLPDLPFPCLIDHKAAVPPLFRWHGSSVARRHGRLFSLPLQPLDPLLQATGSGTWITIVCASGASFPSHRPPPILRSSFERPFLRVSTDRSRRTRRPYHGSKRLLNGHGIGAGATNASQPSIGECRTDRDRRFEGRFRPSSPRPVLEAKRFRYARTSLFGSTISDGAVVSRRGLGGLQSIAEDLCTSLDR